MDFKKHMEQVNKEIMDSIDYDAMVEQDTPEQIKSGPGDMYRNQYNARYRAAKTTFPKGSSAKVWEDAAALLPQLKAAYDRAEDDSESLRKNGDNTRADMVEQQYLEEKFLPIVEAIVMCSTPGEVINNNKVIETLDKYARLGNIGGKGFTKEYIKATFTNMREARPGMSNKLVIDELRTIVRLMQNDEIRMATGLAEKLKAKIDNGELVASPDDYELIQRIVLR